MLNPISKVRATFHCAPNLSIYLHCAYASACMHLPTSHTWPLASHSMMLHSKPNTRRDGDKRRVWSHSARTREWIMDFCANEDVGKMSTESCPVRPEIGFLGAVCGLADYDNDNTDDMGRSWARCSFNLMDCLCILYCRGSIIHIWFECIVYALA